MFSYCSGVRANLILQDQTSFLVSLRAMKGYMLYIRQKAVSHHRVSKVVFAISGFLHILLNADLLQAFFDRKAVRFMCQPEIISPSFQAYLKLYGV